MVVSSDLCPIQCWTVRTSKPRRSMLVAYVDRKVFRSNSSGSRPARSAISLQRRKKFCSRLQSSHFHHLCRFISWESKELDERPHALFLTAARKSLGSC